MKFLYTLFALIIFFSCQKQEEKIAFEFPKETKMKFEEFNEGLDENSTGIIYLGDPISKIKIRYYLGFIKPPERILSKTEAYKRIDDSVQQAHQPFFIQKQLKYLKAL